MILMGESFLMEEIWNGTVRRHVKYCVVMVCLCFSVFLVESEWRKTRKSKKRKYRLYICFLLHKSSINIEVHVSIPSELLVNSYV